nr:MAG TPA: Splicing factor [Caudoviricetes sp.]DAN12076.1 MAG TPA: splicing factor [Caudoviricetes sp.]
MVYKVGFQYPIPHWHVLPCGVQQRQIIDNTCRY